MRPLLVFLLFAALLAAQTSRPSLRRGGSTFFEEKLLDRAPLIVRGTFAKEENVGAVQLTRFTVSAVLLGEPRASVAVVGIGDVSAVGRDVERVLFLKPEGSGRLYSLVEATDLGAGAEDTVASIRHWIETSRVTDPATRRQARRRGVFDGLKSDSLFARRLSVREASLLRKRDPEGFHVSDIPSLRAALKSVPASDRDLLLEVIAALESGIVDPYAGLETGIPEGALRREWINAMAALAASDDPKRRAAVADAVIEGFSPKSDAFVVRALDDLAGSVRAVARKWAVWRDVPEAVPALAKRLASADTAEPEALEIVDALGWLGDDGVAGLVGALSRGGAVIPAVIRALGRIGSPSALNALEGLARKASEDPSLFPESTTTLLRDARTSEFRLREAGGRPRKSTGPLRR